MSHSFFLVPLLSCPTYLSKEINIWLTHFPFIFAGFCYYCNNNLTSQDKFAFYQCVCCPSHETKAATVGCTPQFPCLHKNARIHQRYVKVYTPSIEPSSQPMHDVEDLMNCY